MSDDVVRRTIARVIEALDDQRPIVPYGINQVVRRVAAEPVIEPMLKTLGRLDQQHPGWHLADHQLRYMKSTAGGILRSTDARGRRTHGRIQFKAGDPAKFFTIVVFTLDQVRAMRIGGRKYERHVKNKNDDLAALERLMVEHKAQIVDEVYDLWNPPPDEERGVA